MIYVKREYIEKKVLKDLYIEYCEGNLSFSTEKDFVEHKLRMFKLMTGRTIIDIPRFKTCTLSLTEEECKNYIREVSASTLDVICRLYNSVAESFKYGELGICGTLKFLESQICTLNEQIGTSYSINNIHLLLSHNRCGGLVLDYENEKKVDGENKW